MRKSFLSTIAILSLAALAAPAQERVMEWRTRAGEDRAALARRVASMAAALPEGEGRFRVEGKLARRSAPVLAARPAEAGPAAAIVVLDPAGDAGSEIAMTLQAALLSERWELRSTRNLDKAAGTGESGLPRWQEPAEAHLRELGVPPEIAGDAGLYARWLGAAALVRLQVSGVAVPVILYSPEGERAAESEALASRIQRQLPGSLVVACEECVGDSGAAEVEVHLGARAAEPAEKMAAASALAAGVRGLEAGSERPAAKGELTTPAPGSTLPGASVTFQWAAGTEATNYWLMVGSWLGGNTYYSQDQGSLTSAPVSGLPVDGRTLYVRLWSYINGAWQSSDSTYRAFSSGGAAPAKAVITSPAAGAQLPGASVTFEWTGGVSVARYYLMVGLWPGGNSLYDADLGESRQAAVTGLPVDGRTLYVRLWSYIDGSWQSQDHQYQAAGTFTPAKAEMTSPASGTVLSGSSATFVWSPGNGVQRYYLFAGSWQGGDDLFSRDMLNGLSATVSNLPVNGSTIYVRLWSYINGSWLYHDSTYTASGTAPVPVKAAITAPAPGSTLAGASATFQWSAGTGVQRYHLFVGTSAGNNDIAGSDQALNLAATVTGLPVDGRVLHVRLWSYINGAWQHNDYSYRAAGQ